MANYLSPFATRQFIDANGNPYSGAKLFTYVAGLTTKVTTYKDEAGSSSHSNPIVLNTRGEPADGSAVAYPIWQIGGAAVKYVLAPSTDTDPPGSPIATWDNIDGINDTSVTIDQWIAGPTPTYVSATSFTLAGDQTSTFHIGRRVKTTNSGGTIYSTITNSAYGALTTVTVVNDSSVLDSGLSAVSYGLMTATGTSLPNIIHINGIKFPSTQVPSSDINNLDDYEENTWTPGIAFAGSSTGITYTTQTGAYTKIGNKVFFSCVILLSNKGAQAGSVTVTGFPFSSENVANRHHHFSVHIEDVTYTGRISVRMVNGVTTATLYQTTEAGTTTALANTNLINTSRIELSGHYNTT